MELTIVIEEKDREAFGEHWPRIQDKIRSSFELLSEYFDIGEITLTVLNDPNKVIPEDGTGGWAEDGTHTTLVLDIDSPHFEKAMEQGILETLAHEVHHCMRMRDPGFGETLFESLVSEGLADRFQVEVTGGEHPIWTQALSEHQMREVMKLAAEDLHNPEYNHYDWFFGSKERGIPKWAGYSVGYHIVGKLLEARQETAAELVHIDPQEVLDFLESREGDEVNERKRTTPKIK